MRTALVYTAKSSSAACSSSPTCEIQVHGPVVRPITTQFPVMWFHGHWFEVFPRLYIRDAGKNPLKVEYLHIMVAVVWGPFW